MNSQRNTSKADPDQKLRASSPSMFDDDIVSVVSFEALSQSFQSFGCNQVISNRNIQPPLSSSSGNSKIASSVRFPVTPRSHEMDAAVLSMSQIERVTTCRLCDNTTRLNQCPDNHNRSITYVAQNTLYSEDRLIDYVPESSPKRPRLVEPTDVSFNLNQSWKNVSAETSDLLGRLDDSTKAINDQLVSLHADCGNHLKMVNNITSTMDV